MAPFQTNGPISLPIQHFNNNLLCINVDNGMNEMNGLATVNAFRQKAPLIREQIVVTKTLSGNTPKVWNS